MQVLQFRAARKASEEIGAQIVLGDRPIEITVCKPIDENQCDTFAFFNIMNPKLGIVVESFI